MRVAYGYKRRVTDFAELNVDKVWLDGEDTERMERHGMLNGGLRSGDVLVLLARGDLGPGKQAGEMVKLVEAQGVKIEVNVAALPRGRPGPRPKWVPSDPAKFRRYWKDLTLHGPYVLRKGCEDAKLEPTAENMELIRNRLNRMFGTRGGK